MSADFPYSFPLTTSGAMNWGTPIRPEISFFRKFIPKKLKIVPAGHKAWSEVSLYASPRPRIFSEALFSLLNICFEKIFFEFFRENYFTLPTADCVAECPDEQCPVSA